MIKRGAISSADISEHEQLKLDQNNLNLKIGTIQKHRQLKAAPMTERSVPPDCILK